ncbi:MAG: NADP-specific glutamate dehydrogenase [Bacteroidetes bacterium SW_10_40_5]|nr:MAG: NADP-specific glutamate dehydrogenase [Bacteroidetes bacterium SW_10_40_5]
MDNFLKEAKSNNPGEPEFHQSIAEIYDSVKVVLDKKSHYRRYKVFERMIEPERLISFRVPWVDDQGEIQINRGYRVQMSSTMGPYKGGLRFHPSVNTSILKFLAFEQVLKNALTPLPLGAGKGGADFDTKGKSEMEVMRFCQSFMTEMHRHIGNSTDIPAGDIGVGAREIGYLFGQYKKIKNEFSGVLTGKGVNWGGSLIRPEATGYGVVYFAENMLNHKADSLDGKRCVVSGSGNVAQFAIEKLIELGAQVITISDSSGYIYDEKGITKEKLEFIKDLKNSHRKKLESFKDAYPSLFYQEYEPTMNYNPLWDHQADCFFPCATQNEINLQDAQNIVNNNGKLVIEGANMPTTKDAVKILLDNDVLYAPGKASNAGGVAVSGLEMSQNSVRMGWSREEVDLKLKSIMQNIHDTCLSTANEYGREGDYLFGANIASFTKVADAMIEQGLV